MPTISDAALFRRTALAASPADTVNGVAATWWQQAFRRADDLFMGTAARIAGHRPNLLVLMFHGLFRDRVEAENDTVDPYQPFTEADLRALIRHFLAAGYRFARPDRLSLGLRAAPKRVMLTFDDGYANNLRALPILREFGVPAAFFIAAGNVASGEAFWWDALHRELARRGIGRAAAVAERQRLKAMPTYAIRNTLGSMFGPGVLQPSGETDRPMTPAEVRALAADPLAAIGNHSLDHDLLTRIPPERARDQLTVCQRLLAEWTGSAPQIVAYPNGNCDDRIVAMAEGLGLKTGFVAAPGRTRLPLDPAARMRLPRTAIVGGESLARQLRTAEAPYSLGQMKNHLLHRRPLQAGLR
jgi:peptidoglycan/xylan/chitin deacetylase (PgdA/CDA1 family)